jgi:hypothetical protein
MSYGKLRVHDEVLTEAQILANYNEEKGLYATNPPMVASPLTAGPIHRYSFNNAANNNAEGGVLEDLVGDADGVVIGPGASFTGTGLQLPGGPSTDAPYGDLPNGLISSLTDASVEAWVTVDGVQNWSRIFDFGSTAPGGDDGEVTEPGGGGEGLDYLMLSASQGTANFVARAELRNEDPAGGGVSGSDVIAAGETPTEKKHYTVVYDSNGDEADPTPQLRVYMDGEQVGQTLTDISLSDINDVNNWLGRSNWTGDSNLEGTYDEFRIYDYAMSSEQVRGNFQAGPDTINLGGGAGCDFNGDGNCTNVDIDLLAAAIRAGTNDPQFDLNSDNLVNDADRDIWVRDLKKTWFGDVNLDGEFNSGDLVTAFQIGEYEDGIAGNSGWGEGDWTGDAEFTSGDFVLAFQDGGFEQGPRAAVSAVPEPTGVLLLSVALLAAFGLIARPRVR